MAQVQTGNGKGPLSRAQAGKVESSSKKKRGEGSFLIHFLNEAGEKHTRIPKMVRTIVLDAKEHGSDQYNLEDIPDETLVQLAAKGVKQIASTYVANHAKTDGATARHHMAKVWKDILEGKISSRGESTGKRGRPFDGSNYADAMKAALAIMAKRHVKYNDGTPVVAWTSDNDWEDFKVKLETMPSAARKEKITKMRRNPFFDQQLRMIEAKKLTQDVGEGVESFGF